MTVSLILNFLIIIANIYCLEWGLKHAKPRWSFFMYFTTLSNLLCAAASAAVFIAWHYGEPPMWTLVFKYVGTCAVTVTMLTVLLFLGPFSQDWKAVMGWPELVMHAVCPALAIVSFLFFEKRAMPAWVIALGVLPVLLYAGLYLYKVVYAPEERRWKDFYGFNTGGKWPISCVVMLTAAGLIAFALWAINNGR